MYFPMLVIATKSDWGKKKWNEHQRHTCQQWKVDFWLPRWRDCIRISKMSCAILPKLTKFLVCCWFGHSTYNEPWGLVQCILIFFFLRKLNIVVWEISSLDLCHLSDRPLYSERHPPKLPKKRNDIKAVERQSSSLHLITAVVVNIRAMPQTGETRIGSFKSETRAEGLVLILFLAIFFFFPFFFLFLFKHENKPKKKKKRKMQEWRWEHIRKEILTSSNPTVTDWLALPAVQL